MCPNKADIFVIYKEMYGFKCFYLFQHGRAVPVIVQLVAWVPPTIAVFYVLLNFIWAMFHSQRQRIQSALKGTEGNVAAQLGFMNKVKTEVIS